jgi:hypothetical protein
MRAYHHPSGSLIGWRGAAAAATGAAALLLAPVAFADGGSKAGKVGQTSEEKRQQQSAQSERLQTGQQAQQQTGQAPSEKTAQLYTSKSVKGTIEEIDLMSGELKIKLSEESKAQQEKGLFGERDTLTLKAIPFDLENLREDVETTINYHEFEGGERWLAHQSGKVDEIAKRGWAQQTASGNVEDVDVKEGTIKIDGEEYTAHPDIVRDLMPGQFVSLSFSEFGDGQWVAGVTPSGQGAQQEMKDKEKMEKKSLEKQKQKAQEEARQRSQPSGQPSGQPSY